MERVRGNQARKRIIKWRKIGGGSFRLGNGRIIKPNQVFEAAVEDIPVGFREGSGKVVIPMEDLPQTPAEQIIEPLTGQFIIKARGKSKSWFDVVNSVSEQVMNEKALKRADAEKLLAELS